MWKSGLIVPCTNFPQGENGQPPRWCLHLGGEPGPAIFLLAIVCQWAHLQPTVLAQGWAKVGPLL